MSQIIHGDCLEKLKGLPEGSVDCIVTDPPYGYSFMGKDWDKTVVGVETWKECLRVLKPGAFAFVMSAPRQDVLSRMMVNLADAGFETAFTSIYWTYASGFPKAANIGKMVDKRGGVLLGKDFCVLIKRKREEMGMSLKDLAEAGKFYGQVNHGGSVSNWENGNGCPTAEQYNKLIEILDLGLDPRAEAQREVIGHNNRKAGWFAERDGHDITSAATPAAKALDGSYGGFQPKPALENIICARKPLDLRAELTIMTSQVIKQIDALCLDAFPVATTSNLPETLRESIARAAALEQTIVAASTEAGREGGSSDVTDILRSTSERLTGSRVTSWSIGSLWNASLVVLLADASTFTTETASRTITDLGTLSFLLSQTTPDTTTQDATRASGVRLNVPAVESVLRSVLTICSLAETSAPSPASRAISPLVVDVERAVPADVSSSGRAKASSDSSAPNGATTRPEVSVIIVAMKPLDCKTYVDQALKNGKGLTWLDDARIPTREKAQIQGGYDGETSTPIAAAPSGGKEYPQELGRFPANLLVSDDVLNEYSRFFSLDAWVEKTLPFLIVPKASKREKNDGLGGFEEKFSPTKKKNPHPTVKPLKLMSYLITLGTRQGDTVLDPFLGSGTTACAAKMLGRNYIGIEREDEYVKIAHARVDAVRCYESR